MHYRPRLLVSAFLVAAIIGPLGCNAAPDNPTDIPDNAHPVLVQPLPEAESLRFYSGITTQQRLVVRDSATWATLWQQIVAPYQPAPAVPSIDFAGNVVIVAAMGTRNTGGYSITVDDVHTLADDAWISITEQSPGSGCIVTDALTAPVAVVVVPRFAGRAMFLEHTSQTTCQ